MNHGGHGNCSSTPLLLGMWSGESAVRRIVLASVIAAMAAATMSAQVIPPPPANIPPDVQKHVDAAKKAAGTEWQGLQAAACGTALGLLNPPAPRAGGPGGGR